MRTKRALKEYKGKDGDDFNFIEKDKAARFAKIIRDKREKVCKEARAPRFDKKDNFLLAKGLQDIVEKKGEVKATVFNLLQVVKEAGKKRPSDKGVAGLRILLEKKWGKDRSAELKEKELSEVRAYFSKLYPASFVNELLKLDSTHKNVTKDYGSVTTPPDPMHKRIYTLYTKLAAYPAGKYKEKILPAGIIVKECTDMGLVEGGNFKNPVVIESDNKYYVVERKAFESSYKRILSPEEASKKIAELFVKYPRSKYQIDIVSSDLTGFDVALVKRAEKLGLGNDTKLFLSEWDTFKRTMQASEYTDFVSKYMKENEGSTMSEAAKAWKSNKGGEDEGKEEGKEEEKEEEKEEK